MNYLIDYQIVINGNTISGKTIKVKNQENELFAKVNLENYLRRKYGDSFSSLVVNNIIPDDDFISMFQDIFRRK